jgi:protein-disulfide isomerase
LRSLKINQAEAELVRELRKQASVEILLEPPRLDVEVGDAPRKGPANAPVTIVEFSDFQCPYCKRVQPTLEKILSKYGDQVSLVFKDLPLRTHREAVPAARAARCARDQGKFWEYHDGLFKASQLNKESYQDIAQSLGLDKSVFQACLDSEKYNEQVQADMIQAMTLGAGSTPSFFINGASLRGAQPFEAFAKLIDAELARAEPSSP